MLQPTCGQCSIFFFTYFFPIFKTLKIIFISKAMANYPSASLPTIRHRTSKSLDNLCKYRCEKHIGEGERWAAVGDDFGGNASWKKKHLRYSWMKESGKTWAEAEGAFSKAATSKGFSGAELAASCSHRTSFASGSLDFALGPMKAF